MQGQWLSVQRIGVNGFRFRGLGSGVWVFGVGVWGLGFGIQGDIRPAIVCTRDKGLGVLGGVFYIQLCRYSEGPITCMS